MNKTIGLCGNFPLDALATLLDSHMPNCAFVTGNPENFRDELSNPFGDFLTLDFCILALDWKILAPQIFRFTPGQDINTLQSIIEKNCTDLKTLLENFRKKSPAKILIFSPISDAYSLTGFIDRTLPISQFDLSARIQNQFNELCRSMGDLYPVDLDELSSRIGKDAAFDPIEQMRIGQPFSGVFVSAIACCITDIVRQLVLYPLKCMVLDLDDTLWGGLAGEEGVKNIELGETGIGRAFKNFQELIARLHIHGVILAVCSKNNTCDALEIIEKHPHMLIRPEMISCFRINWDDKTDNLIEIAKELNIGLNSICFIDNSPSEREQMRMALPDVSILNLPTNPALFAQTLKRYTRFWPTQLTKDDLAKAEFSKQDRKRKAGAALSANTEAYLMTCEIRVTIIETLPNSDALPRIAQLFNKTNQFNLTTKRYTQTELEMLLKNGANHLFYLAMTDKFGEYGIIAAALVIGDTIDSLVLSCRAFGKQIETALLMHVMNSMKQKGQAHVTGIFIPTLKNSMTKDFYKNAKFDLVKESAIQSTFTFDLTKEISSFPEWISFSG